MNDQQRMKELRQKISLVYADRERLKQDLDNGNIKPLTGLRELENIDRELSSLDTEFKSLWDRYNA